MRLPAAGGSPRWLLVVGAPAGALAPRTGLREALRAGRAARGTAPEAEPTDFGNDGRGTALEER